MYFGNKQGGEPLRKLNCILLYYDKYSCILCTMDITSVKNFFVFLILPKDLPFTLFLLLLPDVLTLTQQRTHPGK